MTATDQRIVLAVALCGLLLASPTLARQPETGFLNRIVTVNGVQYKYQVFVPNNWNKKIRWPVILYLHGAGQRGDDGLLPTWLDLADVIRQHVERFPFVVAFPQCRQNNWWTTADMETLALQVLDQTMKEFNGDPDRVYLTGVSMGGYGTWDLGSKHISRFAALVPVCGGVVPPPGIPIPTTHTSAAPYAEVARKIGKTPVWVFHGDVDPAVPVAESRRMVEALKAAGGNVRYTESPGLGHTSTNAYPEAELITWLQSQRRSSVR